jgi:aryl-alcohol dehydrogenase-like predicted oxidoreductase
MEVLVAQGKIIYVGSSNFAGWHIAQANDAAAARGRLGLVSEQSIYNLFTREVELEVLPAAARYGVGIIPWSPLHGGLLGGVLKKEAEGRRRRGQRSLDTLRENEPKVRAYEDLCDALGESPANVALAWLLHQPAVTGPIIGPRTAEQLDQAGQAVSLALSAETLRQLDEIFPGYQPAPQHYAW